MLDELDNALIGIINENNKLTPAEIHKKTESKLERSVLRTVVYSRLMGLVESGYLELVETKTDDPKVLKYVYTIKLTE